MILFNRNRNQRSWYKEIPKIRLTSFSAADFYKHYIFLLKAQIEDPSGEIIPWYMKNLQYHFQPDPTVNEGEIALWKQLCSEFLDTNQIPIFFHLRQTKPCLIPQSRASWPWYHMLRSFCSRLVRPHLGITRTIIMIKQECTTEYINIIIIETRFFVIISNTNKHHSPNAKWSSVAQLHPNRNHKILEAKQTTLGVFP